MTEDTLETIGNYWVASKALFLKSVLEGHGIQAFVVGDYSANIFPRVSLFGGTVKGGIELRVFAEDANDARAILNQAEVPETDDEG